MGEAAELMRRKIPAFDAHDRQGVSEVFSPDCTQEVPGANGRIVASYLTWDQLSFIRQLGLAPAPAPA